MFDKALVGGEVLSFPHAPPQTHLDKPDKKKWVQKPYPGADPLYSSVYYYWWAFLRLNDDYIRCCEQGGEGPHRQLYEDFGDVRDGCRATDDGDEFKAWWIERGAILFAEPNVPVLIEEISQIQDTDRNENYLILKIPLLGQPELLGKEITQLIKKKYRDRTGVFSQAMYKAAGSHQLHSLDCMLRIKYAEKELISDKNRTRKPSNPELVRKAGLAIATEPSAAGSDPKAAARNSGSRYLKDANTLIANVIFGSFPDFESPDRTLSERPWLPKQDDPHVIACRDRLAEIHFRSRLLR